MASFSIGLSNFSASIGIGLSGVNARLRTKIAIIFGLFEGVMPIVGILLGRSLANVASDAGRYIGGILLLLTGIYVFWKSVKSKEFGIPKRSFDTRHLLLLGLVLSLDNLIVGFALSFYHIALLLAACIIAGMSVLMSLVGLELGSILGKKFEKWSEELEAIILILIGIAFLIGYI